MERQDYERFFLGQSGFCSHAKVTSRVSGMSDPGYKQANGNIRIHSESSWEINGDYIQYTL